MRRLLGRAAVAIALGVIAVGIDVLVSLIASKTWSWQISLAVFFAAAILYAAAGAVRDRFRTDPPLRPKKLEPQPGDDKLIGRPAEKDQIVRALRRRRRRPNVVILEGAGGYGKSTLARRVATDPRIRRRYRGTYEVSCGEEPDKDWDIADVVNGLLENITRRRPGFTDPNTAGQHLGQVLGQLGQLRKILLVVNDVWTQDQVRPFLVGARRCTRLVTTRTEGLAEDMDPVRIPVGPMSPSQARDLLLRELPPGQADLVRTDLEGQVISRTWHWPLVLTILNKTLLTRVGEGSSADAALREILECISAEGPVGAQDLNVDPGSQEGSHLVESTLEAGLPLLRTPDAKQRLLDLAVFPPRALVPVKLVSGLWVARSSLSEAQAASLRSRMAGLSFFTISDERVQLHDVMHEFLCRQVGEPARAELAGLVVDLLARLVPTAPSGPDGDRPRPAWWDGGDGADYIGAYVVLHLIEAGRRQAAEDLVCDLRWVVYRLEASGTAAVLADLARVDTARTRGLEAVIERHAPGLGEKKLRPDAVQYLLNVMRTEPEWAPQAIALQAGRSEPMLVSHWRLPDNPGPALQYVRPIPSSARRSDAAALSPDGSWLVIAGDAGLFFVDTTTRDLTPLGRPEFPVGQIAIAPDGCRLATLAADRGVLTVYDKTARSVIAQEWDDSGIMRSIAFAPDGASLVTTGHDGRVKLWDARTGERLHGDDREAFPRLFGRSVHYSRDAVVSDDGEWVVSAGEGQVFLWSMPDGRPLESFGSRSGSPWPTEPVAVAPDRAWVAGSNGPVIGVWNTQTGKKIATLEAGRRVMALAVSRDGSHLASGSDDGTLSVWECGGFTLEARLYRHSGVRSVAFSPDGQFLYSGGAAEARKWDLRKAASPASPGESAPVERVLMSPQGTWVAVLGQDSHLRIQNVSSGQIEAIPADDEPDFRAYHLAVAPDGTWLAADCGEIIRVWDTTGWTLTRKFRNDHAIGQVSGLVVSADGRRLFTADGAAVRAWDPGSGNPLACMASLLTDPEALTFSRDGSWLAAGDYNGLIWVWDTQSGDLRATMGGGARHYQLQALAATPENTLLAYPSGTTGDIVTWDVERAEAVGTSAFPAGDWFPEVAISAEGPSLITSDTDTVTYYDLASSRNEVLRGGGHARGGARATVAFSGDGRWFAIDGGDVTEVRERSTRRVHAEVDRGPGGQQYGSPSVIALDFSGDRLASLSGGRLVIWDTATSQIVRELTPRNGHAVAVALSPDGRQVGVASRDQVTILDVMSGRERDLTGNLGGVAAVAFSPAGRYVAIAGSEGVRLWDAGNGRPVAVLQERTDVTRLLFGPREEWLAVAGGSAIELFSVPQAERQKAFPYPLARQEVIYDMVALPDGSRIVARDSAGNLLSVDLDSGRVAALPDVRPGAVDVMMISPNGRWLATGGQDLSVRRLPDGSPVATHRMSRPVKSLDWSPDSGGIVAGGDGGLYYLRFQNQPE